MVIASDIILKGEIWKKAAEVFSGYFKARTHYDLLLVSTAIGVVYDMKEDSTDDGTDLDISVPRNVFNNKSEPFDKLIQTAILTSTTIDLNDEERLKIAFSGEKDDFDRLQFMLGFAYFGIKKLVGLKGVDDLETMDRLKDFILLTMEGKNSEINETLEERIAETIIGYSSN